MAFRLPTFNLTCNIYPMNAPNIPDIPLNPPRIADQICQLTYGRRVNVASTGGTDEAGVPLQSMNLLLPAGVDIRGPQDTVSADMVEVPAGSQRWYWVIFVDDVAKGFGNEHRTAGIFALSGSWLAPYP